MYKDAHKMNDLMSYLKKISKTINISLKLKRSHCDCRLMATVYFIFCIRKHIFSFLISQKGSFATSARLLYVDAHSAADQQGARGTHL